ncbi:MAG: hypothetical protein IJ064_03225 [Bacteroidaceae bacterium]|nr:hypothetical protein [Bacteroidaceae bacterium]
MKKHLLLILACLLATVTYAQQLRVPKLTPLKAPTKADLVTEQPAGELRVYKRTGGATMASLFFENDRRQDGMVAQVVYAADGKTVWFKNIISHAATGTWVKGTIEGDEIHVPYGQLVYWFDNPVDEDNKPIQAYGMQLAEVTVNGAITNYTSDNKGYATFAIQGDSLVLQGTSADIGENQFKGLGLTYTNQFDGEWSYYLDFETVYEQVDANGVTPPADLKVEQYAMTNGIYGHFVKVGFDGQDVYMQGISESYLPDSWMKGTFVSDTKVYFPLQVAGFYSTYLLYYCGTDLEFVNPNYGGTYRYRWNAEETGITFDYDPETRSFTTDRGLVCNNSLDSLDRYERFAKPILRPWVEKAAKPADPAILECNDRFFDAYGITTVSVSIPCQDEDGNYLNPQKLFYRIYLDDDEDFLFYQDEYVNLPIDGVDEMPYLYSNGRSIFPNSYGFYLYQGGFERIGIQSVYYGGDDRQETDIFYTVPVSVGVESVQSSQSTVQSEVYDLSGRRVAKPTKGLYIQNGKKYLIK